MAFLEPITDDTHPVLRERGFAIETPPLKELIEAVQRCVGAAENSLCAYGQPRCGKSTGAQYLAALLQADGATVLSIQIEGRESRKQTDRWEFWDQLLTAANIERHAHSSADARKLLLHQLAVIADRSKNRRIFFIFNEAQNLTIQHLMLLKHLTDELITFRYAPFVLLSGQPDIQNRVDELRQKATSYHDLIDRFFTQWHRWRGLTTDEIGGVLAAYDSLVFPESSNVSYTAHFAPKLWQEGWRLASEAPALAKEFQSRYLGLKQGSLKELNIKYLVASVRWLLTGLQAQEGRGLRPLPASLIPSCVKCSGADESWRIVGETSRVFGQTELGVEPRLVPPA